MQIQSHSLHIINTESYQSQSPNYKYGNTISHNTGQVLLRL